MPAPRGLSTSAAARPCTKLPGQLLEFSLWFHLPDVMGRDYMRDCCWIEVPVALCEAAHNPLSLTELLGCTPASRALLQDMLLCHSFHFSPQESKQPHPPKPFTGLQRAAVLFLLSFPNADSELKSVKEANKNSALHATDCTTSLKSDLALKLMLFLF